MVNSLVINDGKVNVLEDYPPDNDGVDIYSIRPVKPKGYIRHKVMLDGRIEQNILSFFHCEVYDNGYDHFIGDMCLMVKTKPISGEGTMAFCDYLGYSAISSVTIKISEAEYKFDGEYLFNQIMELPANKRDVVLEKAGHNEYCRVATKSEGSYEEVKGSQVLYLPIKLPFGDNYPKNLIPLAKNDVINVTFDIRPVISLINCDSKFVPQERSNFIESTRLTIEMYTKKTSVRPLYEPRIDIPYIISSTMKEVTIPECRLFNMSVKCNSRNNLYPYMIDNWKTEADVVNKYTEVLIENILHVVHNDRKPEFYKQYPSTAKFVEVSNGEVIIRKDDRFNQKRKVEISITNIPLNHTLLYHTNLLVINKELKYDSDKRQRKEHSELYEDEFNAKNTSPMNDDWKTDLNISEKFTSIRGYYDLNLKVIVPVKCEHHIISQYASIPLECYQVLGEDNRKLNSINYSIQSHYSIGPNIFKPRNNILYTLYADTVDHNSIISVGNGADIIDMLRNSTDRYNTIYFTEPQNQSKFCFGNLSSQLCKEFKLVFQPYVFSVIKDELSNMYIQGKELKSLRHRESGFEALFSNITYHITYYVSKQISQVISTNNKSSSMLIA